MAVVVVSAVSRTKVKRGRNTYAGDDLTLASFRESSELEFGADDAYILAPTGDRDAGTVTLRHLKSRHGDPCDLALHFDRAHQRFTPASALSGGTSEGVSKLRSTLAALWNRTPPASERAFAAL